MSPSGMIGLYKKSGQHTYATARSRPIQKQTRTIDSKHHSSRLHNARATGRHHLRRYSDRAGFDFPDVITVYTTLQ